MFPEPSGDFPTDMGGEPSGVVVPDLALVLCSILELSCKPGLDLGLEELGVSVVS